MTTDPTGREPELSPTDAGGAMFSATPVWERSRKKSRFGGGKPVAAEPRSFSAGTEPAAGLATDLNGPLDRPMAAAPIERSPDPMSRPMTSEPVMSRFAASPGESADAHPTIARPQTVKAKNTSSAVPMIAGAVGAVALLGGVGWFATRGNDGVPELTPGSATSEVAMAPVMPAAPVEPTASPVAPTPVAAAPVQTASAPAPIVTARRAAPAARVRPAATNAGQTGVDASTAIPDAPQPYSGTSSSAAPPVVTVPTPAPVVEAAPATPPVTTEAAPPATTAEPVTPPT